MEKPKVSIVEVKRIHVNKKSNVKIWMTSEQYEHLIKHVIFVPRQITFDKGMGCSVEKA